jgi:hypothetical protein
VLEAEIADEGQQFCRVSLAPVGHSQPVADFELLRMAQYASVCAADKNAGVIFLLDGERVFCALT